MAIINKEEGVSHYVWFTSYCKWGVS